MNKNQAYIQLKNSINKLSNIPDELIDNLFNICKLVQFKKGEQFLLAGDVPEYMGFNLNGVFRLYYIDNNGNDFTKGFCTQGKFVVSYSAMAQQRESYFFIEALVNTDILQFKYLEWMRMIEKDIRWYPFIFKLLENVYIMKELREKSFLLEDAKTRYLNFKKDYPGLEEKINLYHIASFLGITPESLSRIRNMLKIDLDQ